MRNFTWNRFPIKNLLIDSLLTPIVESTYFHRDMCKFESSQKDESRWQSTDSSKAYRNTSAFKCVCFWSCWISTVWKDAEYTFPIFAAQWQKHARSHGGIQGQCSPKLLLCPPNFVVPKKIVSNIYSIIENKNISPLKCIFLLQSIKSGCGPGQ